MPCLQIQNKTSGTIPIGTMIVVDDMKARAYDSDTDSLDDVVGTVFATSYVSGREFNIGTGPDYYDLDYYQWGEDLTNVLDDGGNPIPNPNYDDTFNPWADTIHYSTIQYDGFGVVLSSYTSLPARWKVLQTNTDLNWVLIR